MAHAVVMNAPSVAVRLLRWVALLPLRLVRFLANYALLRLEDSRAYRVFLILNAVPYGFCLFIAAPAVALVLSGGSAAYRSNLDRVAFNEGLVTLAVVWTALMLHAFVGKLRTGE